MQQAKQADEDFAKGIDKSPLQGIPYGLKDLFAVKGTKTTYGTPPFKDQVIDEDAFVYQQLEKAGAVLIAKLSMGELAMDDIWFGGQTKNPWDLQQGSKWLICRFRFCYCSRIGAVCYWHRKPMALL